MIRFKKKRCSWSHKLTDEILLNLHEKVNLSTQLTVIFYKQISLLTKTHLTTPISYLGCL